MEVRSRSRALRSSWPAALCALACACGGSAQLDGNSASAGTSSSGATGNGGAGAVNPGGPIIGAGSGGLPQAGSGGAPQGGSAGTSQGGAPNPPQGGSAGTPQGGAAPIGPFACDNPSYTASGYQAGFSACAQGLPHRSKIVTCPSADGDQGAAGEAGASSTGQAKLGDPCTSDADCAGLFRGYCPPGPFPMACQTNCRTDADCGPGFDCLCSHVGGSCAPATCASDADCAPGTYCVQQMSTDLCGVNPGVLSCDDGHDLCNSDADCAKDFVCKVYEGRRNCVPGAVCSVFF